MAIKTVYGDVLDSDANAILHQVNCRGVMGSGLAKQIRKRYPEVFERYAYECGRLQCDPDKLLGIALPVKINSYQWIVNLFSQDGYGWGKCYTDYDSLRICLRATNSMFEGMKVAIPYKMSCCRGGGNWDVVYRIIEEELKDCEVEIYKLKRESS